MTPKALFLTLCPLALLALSSLGALGGCNTEIAQEDLASWEPRVEVYFNSPGVGRNTHVIRQPAEMLMERIDMARVSVDTAVYGFSHPGIVQALLRAHDRGVRVRIVGDAKSFYHRSWGFVAAEEKRIPIQVGNQFHIMHNKFFVIDERQVFVGTGNISTTDVEQNNNNWLFIDSPPVARSFAAEFQQMFEGRFSIAKRPSGEPNAFQVGDTRVEVLFSPHEDTMGKVLQEVKRAHTSVHFNIFAFTKDQVADLFIDHHRAFERFNQENGAANRPLFERPKRVVGIMDRSQLHGNGQYHQSYRLGAAGVPLRMDANENSRQPGDYQAGGGRLHAKTMILDWGTPDARVVTGSFNWSSAATISNDEVLLILHSPRLADLYMEEFFNMWAQAKDLPQSVCNYMVNPTSLICSHEVQPGDVVISEVHWDGWNNERDPSDHTGASERRDRITDDHFIELYNTTQRPVNLSMWTISNGQDVAMGFPPGTVIGPGQHFLVLDHNTEPLNERDPQYDTHAFRNPDFLLNVPNDPRQRRLNFKKSNLDVVLKSADARVIDRAGDGGPPFFGGRREEGGKVRNLSMERILVGGRPLGEGTARQSWKACSLAQGGNNVVERFRDYIIATPGESNSP